MNILQGRVPEIFMRYIFIFLGSVLTAVGLEIFLKAHNLIGGGIIGTAVVVSYLTELPASAVVVLLNCPFLYLGYKRQGRSILVPTAFALLSLAFWIWIFSPLSIENQEILHSTIFGGISLGVGSGLVLQYGGYVDGMEYHRKAFKMRLSRITNSRAVLINLPILCAAGLVFGMDRVGYSLIAYFVVFKAVDITLELLEKTRRLIIITGEGEEIAQNITGRMGKRVSFIHSPEAWERNMKVLSCRTSTHELAELQSIIHEVDANADIFFAPTPAPKK